MASRAYNLVEFVKILESWGLRDVMMPFLLIFVVIFALLTKISVFGKDKRKLNLVFALVVAALFVTPHVLGKYPDNMDPVDILNEALPSISIIIIAAIGGIIFIGAFGGEIVDRPAYITGGVVIVAAVIYLIFVYPDLSPILLAVALILLWVTYFSNSKKEGFNYVQAAVTIGAFSIVLYLMTFHRFTVGGIIPATNSVSGRTFVVILTKPYLYPCLI